MPKSDSAIKINYMCMLVEQMQSYKKEKSAFQNSNDVYYDDQLFSICCRF